MRSIPTLRQSAAAILLASALLALPARAASIPGEFLADSTVVAGASGAVLDVNSDSHLQMVLLPLLATYVLNQNFRIILNAVNTRTTQGGPFPVSGVYFEILLSYHLAFIQCLAAAITCTAEPDPESGGTLVTGTLGDLNAGDTQTLEVEVQPTQVGEASVEGTLHQDDFDPNASNNQVNLTINISEPQPGAIRGYKFEDVNGNGIWEADEPGLNDWTIRLLQASTEATTLTRDIPPYGDGVNSPIETGWYEFLDVAPGDYQVHEDVQEGWVQSAPAGVFYEIHVDEGEEEGPLEFGNFRPGTIMGSVYDDKDANGTFGAGDAGVGSHTVTLSGMDGMGNAVSATATTAADGTYGFANLNPGTYTVTSTAPASLPEVKATPAPILLYSGSAVEAANFGFGATAAPRLEVTVDPVDVEVFIGTLVPFTVTVTNTGNAAAVAAKVGVGYPFSMEVESTSPASTDCSDSNGLYSRGVTCQIGDLAPSASVEYIFRIRVREAATANPGSVTVIGAANASNHPVVFATATVLGKPLEIDLGVFRAGAAGGGKTAAGEVDVYLDSVLVASNIAEGAALQIAAADLGSAEPMLHVLPTGVTDLSQAQFVEQLQFGEGEGDAYALPSSYFLLLQGGETVDGVIPMRDAQLQASTSGSVAFALIHAAPGLGEVDLTTTELGTVPISPGSATGYGEVSASVQDLQVLAPGTQDVLASFRFDWSDDGGKSFVLVLQDGPVLQSVAADGTISSAGDPTGTEQAELPSRVSLYANYPNPFNPVTTIGYALPAPGEVRLEVFDTLGRRVSMLVQGMRPAGRHEVTFSAGNLPSGLYVYRLTAGEVVQARTLVVLK